MDQELEFLKKKFGKKLIGKASMVRVVCETLLLFPRKIQDKIARNCWFISSFDDAWGFTLSAEDIKLGKHLIFLSDELFNEPKAQQRYTIAHEIGHVILGHRNAILEQQTLSGTRKQEKEADEFAKAWLNKAQ
jgi:hypothetical protein